MVGSCTSLPIVAICYLAVFVVSMTVDLGFAESTPMITVNLMSLLKKPANIGFLAISNWKNTVASVLKNGKNALKFMNRRSNLSCQCLILSIGALLLSPLSFSPLLAQEISLESRIQSANESLATLDNQARACLNIFEQGDSNTTAYRCDDFIQSVDGTLLENYLTHCEALKTWREEFVTSESTNSNFSADDAVTNLRLLSGIELVCGENALQKRTEYVFSAFSLLQGEQSQNRSSTLGNRYLKEFEQEQLLNTERRRLQSSVLEQQQRRRLETNQQLRDLENELLRQQIIRRPLPGN